MRESEARMDQRDQELLDKQMRRCQPPPPDSVPLAAFGAALFVSGLVVGSLLLGPTDRTEYGQRIASQHTVNGLN